MYVFCKTILEHSGIVRLLIWFICSWIKKVTSGQNFELLLHMIATWQTRTTPVVKPWVGSTHGITTKILPAMPLLAIYLWHIMCLKFVTALELAEKFGGSCREIILYGYVRKYGCVRWWCTVPEVCANWSTQHKNIFLSILDILVH
jgi:hypothetical protein